MQIQMCLYCWQQTIAFFAIPVNEWNYLKQKIVLGNSTSTAIAKLFIDERAARALYTKLAEVPGAARVNLQPAEHIKNVSFRF